MKSMKRFVLCLAVGLLLAACNEEPYVVTSRKGGNIEYQVADFCNMKELCYNGHETICWDEKTDVLYYIYHESVMGMTPIMKPDGSCLTLSEWEKEHIK